MNWNEFEREMEKMSHDLDKMSEKIEGNVGSIGSSGGSGGNSGQPIYTDMNYITSVVQGNYLEDSTLKDSTSTSFTPKEIKIANKTLEKIKERIDENIHTKYESTEHRRWMDILKKLRKRFKEIVNSDGWKKFWTWD